MKIVCLNWCADDLFVKTAGAAAAEGTVMVQPFAPPSANKPGHKEVDDYLKSKGIDLEAKGLHYVQGWYTMHVMVKGMRKVLNDGKELTGENIRKALETMPAVDTGGVVGAVIKFTALTATVAQRHGRLPGQGGQVVELEVERQAVTTSTTSTASTQWRGSPPARAPATPAGHERAPCSRSTTSRSSTTR